MKTRDSGMPPEEMWHGYFDSKTILEQLQLTSNSKSVVDFGCGYGTFSIPAAQMVNGIVHAIDIDAEMVAATKSKASDLNLSNLQVIQRDFVEMGSGLPETSVDYVMLFNILHAEEAPSLLAEAKRILKVGGKLSVIHWNYDSSTPRGPRMDIRLKPEQCVDLVRMSGFAVGDLVSLPPFHYGFVGTLED